MSSNTTDSSKPAEAEAQPGYYETAKQYASSGAQYASDSVSAGTSYVGKKYEEALPWIEDKYLQYFTNDNKASYATKEQLEQTKVTGVEPVNKLQDGVNSLVGGQLGKGGAGEGVGDLVSKEGINRAERGGKDEEGKFI